MEGREKVVRIVPDCYNPSQDKQGIIHFVDADDIILNVAFVDEWVCSGCWGREYDDCCDDVLSVHCVRHDILDNVKSAVKLLNCALTDLHFGVFVGLYDTEVKRIARDNNT